MVYVINGEHLTRRKLVTIDGSMVTSETAIPLGININLPGVKAAGVDVRLAKLDGTPIAREIECKDVPNTDDVMIWYPFDTVAGTSSQFYVYWGNPALTEPAEDATYGREAVWDSNFVGVWHMNTYDPLRDSTSYDHDGAKGAGIDASNLVNSDAGYGKGINFEGTATDLFTVTHTSDLNINQHTIELYGTQDTNPNNYPGALMKVGAYGLYKRKSSISPASMNHTAWKSTVAIHSMDPGVMPLGSPYYWTGRYDGTNIKIYKDSSEIDSDPVTSPIDTSANNLIIGIYPAAGYWDGIISELRLSKISRSTNYISTTYNNINNPTSSGGSPFYSSVSASQHQRRTPQLI